MLIREFLNKDPDIVPEEAPIIILDSNSGVCMSNDVKDTKHTMQIKRRAKDIINEENFKIHKIDWCEGGLQLAEIDTKNIGDHDLTPRMKYIMVRLYKQDRTLVQQG